MAKQSNYWYVRRQTEIRTKPTADVALSAENVVILGGVVEYSSELHE